MFSEIFSEVHGSADTKSFEEKNSALASDFILKARLTSISLSTSAG
jgi:hypothetical protein